jgi:hypothetical protein
MEFDMSTAALSFVFRFSWVPFCFELLSAHVAKAI